MGRIFLRVDKSKTRTPNEEFDYINEELDKVNNFFPWDEHPNKVRTAAIQARRLRKKLVALIDSYEFQYYNPGYRKSSYVSPPVE